MEGSNRRPEGSAPIQLYSLGTPNGQKISIALEEMGLAYDAHRIDINAGVQKTEWYIKEVNPNSKIPAIIDKEAEGGPLQVFESGAILLYLAKKSGKFLPTDTRKQAQTISWLMWQMAGLGPMTGQMGHFVRFSKVDVPYAKERYTDETKRLWHVLEKQLEGNEYVIGAEYTIADMAIYPWIYLVLKNYSNWSETVGPIPNIERWLKTVAARPAVQRGVLVTPMELPK